MDISTLALKLIILLFPGLIAALIYRRLTIKHKERSDFMFMLIAITEGIFSYLTIQTVYFVAVFIHNRVTSNIWEYETIRAFKYVSDSTIIPYGEIMCASVAAVVISIVTVKISHHNLLNKYALKYNISNKYGEENLFSKFLNENCLGWVYVKDIPNEIVYQGEVQSFSESDEFKEIVLSQVTVYQYFKDEEYKELFEVPRIYLSLPKDKVIIEEANIIENHG
jgi:hypothetical protein